MIAHPLVRAEWPHVVTVPAYDFQVAAEEVHLGVYVRRVSGDGWHVLAGLINHVVVAPHARGRGFGSAAVLDAVTQLAEADVPFALIHCDPQGAGFYAQLGFNPAPNFPAPSHRGERVSMVAAVGKRAWPTSDVEYVEPW